jgi:predicted RND superfamily exporter protein
METTKEASKFSFGLGVFLFITFGYTILLTGFDIKSTLGFLLGIYNIWQHGFVNDASKWKVKPKLILIISVILLLSAYGFLHIRKSSNSQNKFITRKDIIEEVVRLSNQELPKSVGDNGDSIIKISAINENTLEYLYKMNSKIADIDSVTLKSFESETRGLLKDNMTKSNPDHLNEYRKNKINFRHKYVDIDGNVISIIEFKSSDY